MRIARQTTVVTDHTPEPVGEKKVLFRANQIVWYVFNLIAILLALRILLKALGANPFAGFSSLIYSITAPLLIPFNGLFPASAAGRNVVEWSSVLAIVVYLLIALGINYLLDLMYPISDRDVETRI
jgi:uncharacterized protein YggT (Ycf19 family)